MPSTCHCNCYKTKAIRHVRQPRGNQARADRRQVMIVSPFRPGSLKISLLHGLLSPILAPDRTVRSASYWLPWALQNWGTSGSFFRRSFSFFSSSRRLRISSSRSFCSCRIAAFSQRGQSWLLKISCFLALNIGQFWSRYSSQRSQAPNNVMIHLPHLEQHIIDFFSVTHMVGASLLARVVSWWIDFGAQSLSTQFPLC